MTMTQSVMLYLGLLALLATIGMFVEFGDDATKVLVTFTASILWGIIGLNSFDVTIVSQAKIIHLELLPMVYIGVGFSGVTAAFALKFLFDLFKAETSAGDLDADSLRR